MEHFEELTIEDLKKFINKAQTKYDTAHKKLCFAIIKRLYRRVKLGYNFGKIKVCEEKGIVLEGNHRYIAYLLAGVEIEYIIGTSSFSDVSRNFREISIDDVNDWDIHQYKTKKFITDDFLKDL